MSGFNLSKFETLFSDSEDLRHDIVTMARTSEAAERYEDMCKIMKYLVDKIALDKKEALTVDERNLLSVAYKNVIGTLRASWRTLAAEAESAEGKHADNVKTYNKLVEDELVSTCQEVLNILKDLIPTATDVEASVFYLKMAGDYYRYLAESVQDSTEYPQMAKKYYQEAFEKATTNDGDNPALVPTHPIRLGLALNYSVCHYEILKDPKAACELAKKAFDDAIAKLDKLEESDYKDSTLIMQLLRDNLTLWSSSDTGERVLVEDLSDEEN